MSSVEETKIQEAILICEMSRSRNRRCFVVCDSSICLHVIVGMCVRAFSCSGNQIEYLKQYIRQLKKRQIEADMSLFRTTAIYRHHTGKSSATHISRWCDIERVKENRESVRLFFFSFFVNKK